MQFMIFQHGSKMVLIQSMLTGIVVIKWKDNYIHLYLVIKFGNPF